MRSLLQIRSAVAVALAAGALLAVPAAAPAKTAFDENGMWIWYVNDSSGGSPSAIADRARRYGVGTVFVKSGDGPRYWSQFSAGLIEALRSRGLNVCAWQYVYGDHPKDEAKVAAHAIEKGADCFVIDAEVQYEGQYSAARKYMRKLRNEAGSRYPIALAGFPYTDYHPAFPYSVFFGPGGAQYNLPQAYWKDIGGSATEILDHTYLWNRPYDRRIRPLGQVYGDPDRRQIMRFRKYARAARSPAVSWWVWQFAGSAQWDAIRDRLSAFSYPIETRYASISKGAKGDIVYWAQQHLVAAGQELGVDGDFGSQTKRAVKRVQAKVGLEQTGTIDSATWTALLSYDLGAQRAKAAPRQSVPATPRTARLPARRYEIPPAAERAP
ncbi:MAG TPA: peptidoglycan-binding domain-containing protein [Thermoleophilaceae bacterium]|nr:peptidoglycan-binding domain-containing protein [Thermoleophilaceae bacterium]